MSNTTTTTTTPTSSPFPLRRRLTGILDDKPESEMASMRQNLTTLSPPTSPAAPLRRRLSGILDDKQLATSQELALVKQLHDSQKSLLLTGGVPSSPPSSSSTTSISSSPMSLRRRMTGIFDEPGARELAMMEQLRLDSSSSSSLNA